MSTKKTAYERLLNVQSELNAPKNLFNSFGKYKYRNLEGILEALKPLLLRYELTLKIEDSVILVGDRYYIEAIATIRDVKTGEVIETSKALAREAQSKKGMDDSQVTGTASSYARKYCLNGLFLIDDTKDADTDEFQKQTNRPQHQTQPAKTNAPTQKDIDTLSSLIREKTPIDLNGVLQAENATMEQLLKDWTLYNRIMNNLNG